MPSKKGYYFVLDNDGSYSAIYVQADLKEKKRKHIEKRLMNNNMYYGPIPIPKKKIRRRIKTKTLSEIIQTEESYKDRTIEAIEEIASLGYPFIKHRKGSQAYLNAIHEYDKAFQKHRGKVQEAFKLAAKYFKFHNFIYKPKNISIASFIKYPDIEINMIPTIKKLGVKSWMKEFIKGVDYIESKYLRYKKDNNNKITEEISKKYSRLYNQEISLQDMNNFSIASQTIKELCEKHNIGFKTITDVIFQWIKQNFKNKPSSNYFRSDNFLDHDIEAALIEYGVIKEMEV